MIVCLGWGSLIWNQGELAIIGKWEPNGPIVPVEYLRQSIDGRLTLVIDENASRCTVLWAKMKIKVLVEAKKNLQDREGTVSKHIGSWCNGEDCPKCIPDLDKWAISNNVDSVIWTALPPKFNNIDCRKPTYEEALEYLHNLPPNKSTLAKEYVCKTPEQIQTKFREGFERDLGWMQK